LGARDSLRVIPCARAQARIAMVAIHLGLTDDAERLYVQCGRYHAAARWAPLPLS
jgi:hypothetical protein